MNTLVIGGTGLISTAVTQHLLDRGDTVTVLNRGVTPVRFRGDVKRLTGDRTDRQAFEDTIRRAGPWDCVIDMICSDPDDAASLECACRGATGQVVFCSTTNVYPKPADAYPVREDHRLGAAFRNGIDKAACERIHREAEARGDYAVTIVRPGHTYGEGGAILHSLGNATGLIDRMRHGRPVIVHSDGNGLWSALHADDVARVLVAAVGNSTAFAQTYNATGEEWMTWSQYYVRIGEALGVEPPPLVRVPVDILVDLAPQRAAQVARSLQFPGIYDMTQARTDLGWKQTVPFRAGVRRTVEWLDQNTRIDPWQSDPDYDRVVTAWEALRARIAHP